MLRRFVFPVFIDMLSSCLLSDVQEVEFFFTVLFHDGSFILFIYFIYVKGSTQCLRNSAEEKFA